MLKYFTIINIFLFYGCGNYLKDNALVRYFTKEPGRPPKVKVKSADGKEETVQVPDRYRKVYVHNFQNNSYGPGLHVMLTQALKSEIDRRGRFIQTRDKSEAMFRIYGSVTHYQKIGNIMDYANQQISSEITMLAKIELQDSAGEKIQLPRDEAMGRAYYSEQIGYRESEEQAQLRMVNNLAMRLSEETEDGWYYHIVNTYYPPEEKKE